MSSVEVRGCGCRYRISHNTNYVSDKLIECEYICSDHKNKFILDLFNNQLKNYIVKDYVEVD